MCVSLAVWLGAPPAPPAPLLGYLGSAGGPWGTAAAPPTHPAALSESVERGGRVCSAASMVSVVEHC